MKNLLRPLKSQSGFTLIELTAVIAVTGILLTLISALFVQIINSNVKATVANDIRGNGQYMMETTVRALRVADIITGSGKVGSISVTSGGTTSVYAFNCGNLTKDANQVNTSKIVVSSSCNNPAVGESYFDVTPPTGSAPTTVRVVMVLKTTGSALHSEYIGNQTFSQLVEIRSYAK